MKTPAEELGYEVGMEFEITEENTFTLGSHVVLVEDDGSAYPLFELIKGKCFFSVGRDNSPGAFVDLEYLKPIKATKDKDMRYPKKGQQFTISENKKNGERFFTNEVLTCEGVNELSVVFSASKAKQVVLLKSDFDFAVMPETKETPVSKKAFEPSKNQWASVFNAPKTQVQEIDLPLVVKKAFKPYKNQPVLVRNFNDEQWISRFASGKQVCKGFFQVYKLGVSSQTAKSFVSRIKETNYRQCKPDVGAPSILNWIEHDGSSECPVPYDSTIIVQFVRSHTKNVHTTYCEVPKNQKWTQVLRWAKIDLPHKS